MADRLAVTRFMLDRFRSAIREFDFDARVASGIDPVLVDAELRAMKSVVADLEGDARRLELESAPDEP